MPGRIFPLPLEPENSPNAAGRQADQLLGTLWLPTARGRLRQKVPSEDNISWQQCQLSEAQQQLEASSWPAGEARPACSKILEHGGFYCISRGGGVAWTILADFKYCCLKIYITTLIYE